MENPLGQGMRELPGPLLLTGHTGFKGTWMTFLLEHLNLPVVGYSLPPERGSLFERAERTGAISEKFADVRDYKELEKFIDHHKPSTIIHMAAQPLVLKSYENPRETFDVNVMGTVNLLDIAIKKEFVRAVVVVSTDKVYRNDNTGKAFVETDPLEGKDPYSASKVGTEAVVSAWQQISKISGGPRIVSVRSGNVIGGGDFADNRIIPDLIRGVMSGNAVEIRNPNNTRPWQHVVDPLIGYLQVLECILQGNTELVSINFGTGDFSLSVKQITEIGLEFFPSLSDTLRTSQATPSSIEAATLELNSAASYDVLGWKSKWNSTESAQRTYSWWRKHLEEGLDPWNLCQADLDEYFK